MQQIYTARDDMEAHFVQSLLEAEDIPSVIQGEALEGAWSTVRVSSTSLPGVWVDEADVSRAEPIIAEYDAREQKHAREPEADDAPATATWKCPKCGEEVEEQFDECWNCGTDKPGTEGAATAEASPQPE